jgi:hypothetical protein
MKKLVGIAAVAVCLSMVGVSEAKAGGPYYLHFKDYCDCLTLRTGNLAGHAWVFGTWDWQCDGSAGSLVHGLKVPEFVMGTQPVDSSGAPAGFSATIALEGSGQGSNHAHITATFDGVTSVLIADEADYYLRLGPPCPIPNGKPPLFP